MKKGKSGIRRHLSEYPYDTKVVIVSYTAHVTWEALLTKEAASDPAALTHYDNQAKDKLAGIITRAEIYQEQQDIPKDGGAE